MKSIIGVIVCCLLTVAAICIGADAVVPVVPAVPVAPAEPSGFSAVIAWVMANQVVVGLFLAAIMDFIFAINPNWKSNGLLHFIYTLVQKKTTPPPAA